MITTINLDAFRILLEGATKDGVDCYSAAEAYGNGSAIEIETGIFLYGLVRRYKPRLVLETGTHWGFSAAWIALALQDNGKDYPDFAGHLITIDADGYNGRPKDLWKKLQLSNITHVIGNSEDPRTLEQLTLHSCIDAIWFDADHSAGAIWREYKTYHPYLNKDQALIGFHDTRLDKRMDEGVKAIVNNLYDEICDEKSSHKWKFIEHVPWRNLRGLDLIFLHS